MKIGGVETRFRSPLHLHTFRVKSAASSLFASNCNVSLPYFNSWPRFLVSTKYMIFTCLISVLTFKPQRQRVTKANTNKELILLGSKRNK